MHFNTYLKTCRQKYALTQESFVQALYDFDETFTGLDVRTLARWESAETTPPVHKQILIIKLLRQYSKHIYPCFNSIKNREEYLCQEGIKNLIGASKVHIINFPENILNVNNIEISHIRSHQNIDLLLSMPQSILETRLEKYFNISVELLKSWALHPSNLFLVAQSNNTFVGMLLNLRLKPSVFKAVLAFEKSLETLSSDDFASFDEEGSVYPMSVFAYNSDIASLLYIRFYAHIIAHQDTIVEVGAIAFVEDAKKLLEKIHLHLLHSKKIEGERLSVYSAPLEDVIINKEILKMIFSDTDCK